MKDKWRRRDSNLISYYRKCLDRCKIKSYNTVACYSQVDSSKTREVWKTVKALWHACMSAVVVLTPYANNLINNTWINIKKHQQQQHETNERRRSYQQGIRSYQLESLKRQHEDLIHCSQLIYREGPYHEFSVENVSKITLVSIRVHLVHWLVSRCIVEKKKPI